MRPSTPHKLDLTCSGFLVLEAPPRQKYLLGKVVGRHFPEPHVCVVQVCLERGKDDLLQEFAFTLCFVAPLFFICFICFIMRYK